MVSRPRPSGQSQGGHDHQDHDADACSTCTCAPTTGPGTELAADLARFVADTNRAQFITVLGPERAHQAAQAMTELYEAIQDTDR